MQDFCSRGRKGVKDPMHHYVFIWTGGLIALHTCVFFTHFSSRRISCIYDEKLASAIKRGHKKMCGHTKIVWPHIFVASLCPTIFLYRIPLCSLSTCTPTLCMFWIEIVFWMPNQMLNRSLVSLFQQKIFLLILCDGLSMWVHVKSDTNNGFHTNVILGHFVWERETEH